MSGEDEGEENDQKDDFSSSKEFDFYFPFTKPLVLDLPTEEDRVTASAWVQKLETEPDTVEEKKQRLNYLKLLLFVLQRGRLSGIFKKQPPSGPLQPFPQGFTIFDMGNWILDQDDTQTCGGGDGGRVSYTVEISNDLREFVASQEIPNFGVQMYYAWSSDEPIHKWSAFDEDKFPQYILDKIKQLQDIRSEDKSSGKLSNGSTKKKGCNLSPSEKYSKKKVKSPQEIERSQGRSFHTYMGLIGRMGNFNDKCDDDPEKFQRPDQRKGKCPRRSGQKRCPGSGGEVEEMPGEEEFDNLVSGLGGFNSLNRPCFCTYPSHHTECSDHHSKGGSQPYEDQATPNRSCGFSCRSDPDNLQCTATVSKGGPRRIGELCPEGEMSQVLPPQRRSPSPRARSSSPNRPNIDCPTGDDSGGFSTRGGICICSSPCTCPCPRGTPKMSNHKTPPPCAAGRTFPDPSRTFLKSPKQDPCGFEGDRTTGPCHPSYNQADTWNLMHRSDISPVGGRTGASTGLRPMPPEVIHCYDSKNPDPALTKTLEKNANWVQTIGGGNRYMNTDLKLACGRDQLIQAAQQNKCKMTSRRELFSISQSPPLHSTACPQSTGVAKVSPPLESHPLCEYSPPEEGGTQCPAMPNQGPYSNYLDYEGSTPPPQTRTGCHDNCGRQKTDTYKKTGFSTVNRSKNTSSYTGGPGPYAASNNSGRMTNMSNALQGIKQKTEAHREKCSQMRSPGRSEGGSHHSPQSADSCSPSSLEKGYLGIPLPHDQCPKPNSPYPGYFPETQPNYEQDECEAEYEEEDECECESSESRETCPIETVAKRLPRNDMQSCGLQNLGVRDEAEYYSKTVTPGDYGMGYPDDHYCEQQYANADDSPSIIENTLEDGRYPMNFMEAEGQSCPYRRTSPGKSPDTRMGNTTKDCASQRTPPGRGQRDCGASVRTTPNRSNRPQRMSPRRPSPSECMNQEPQECFTSFQDSDRETNDSSVLSPSLAGNRYFNESFKARSGTPYKPVTSTPLLHYKRNFQDQGNDDLSSIRPPSNRCV